MATSLLQKLALEVFRTGKPLNVAVGALVEIEYNRVLNKAKKLVRKNPNFDEVRGALLVDGLQPNVATSIALEAGQQVSREIADEKQLREATESAQTLYKNGVRFDSVVNDLISQGCTQDFAGRIAKENQHYYKA